MNESTSGSAEAPRNTRTTVVASLALLAVLAVTVVFSTWIGRDTPDVTTRALQLDDAARADVTNLGHDLALFFVDYDDEPVSVSEDGDAYVISSVVAEWSVERSPGVDLGGFVASAEDWCVWVVAPEGAVKTVHYTPGQRAAEGECAVETMTSMPAPTAGQP